MCAMSLQSYPILCNPMDSSLPGSSVHGILLARMLELVPSDSLSHCLPSYWGFSYLGCELSLHTVVSAPAKCSRCPLPWTWGISSRLPLLTLDMGYLLSATHRSSAAQPVLTQYVWLNVCLQHLPLTKVQILNILKV